MTNADEGFSPLTSIQPVDEKFVHHWINRKDYPFQNNYFATDKGKVHYVDEGKGQPIVMVHGNPSWSYEYRHLIKGLSHRYRCIAVDHLGFGLSDKPVNVEYTPELHAENLTLLIQSLGLKDIILMVGDWGGPIGLSYAVEHPGNVSKVVLFNSWAWPVNGDWYYEGFSRFMGGPVGRYLILNHNFFVNTVMRKAVSRQHVLTAEVMEHYRKPFTNKDDLIACAAFPKQILKSKQWLTELWSKRDNFVHLPFLVLWGKDDIAFRMKEFRCWWAELKNAQCEVFEATGHFVPEERPEESLAIIGGFLE